MDSPIGLVLVGTAIFVARILDVSLGTLRIITLYKEEPGLPSGLVSLK